VGNNTTLVDVRSRRRRDDPNASSQRTESWRLGCRPVGIGDLGQPTEWR